MHTLFGFKGSGSAAVEVALEMAALPFRLVHAASWENSPALAELAQVNPLKQIPTLLLPDGSVMTESAAILIHLGLVCPASGLLPAEAVARAQALRGLVYVAANCYSAISIIDFPERWCADAETDDAVKERVRRGTRARLHHHWDLFADQFAAPQLLDGPAPGALGILAAVVSRWAGSRAHLQASHPALAALLERIDAHPAVAPVFARHWPA